MKKTVLLLCYVCIVAVFSFTAFAHFEMSISSITIGNDRSERSNFKEDFVVRESSSFTLKNNDATLDISNLDIRASGLSSVYNCSFAFTNATLISGQSIEVTTTCTIPDSLDSVDSSLSKNPIQIGNVVVSGIKNSTQIQKSIDLKMQAENMLEIKNVFVKINQESERSYSDGKTVRDLKPGYKLEITVEARNNFATSRREDFDIEDVEVTIESDERDIDILDSSFSLGRISAKRTDKGSTDIIIDEFIDSGSTSDYPLFITVEGVDENGARHAERFEITLEVKRKSYEFEISELRYPKQLFCGDRDLPITIRMKNIGRNDDDTFGLNVNSEELDFTRRIENIFLNQNDERTESIVVPIPSTTIPGQKQITVTTLHRRNEVSNQESFFVAVPDCSFEEEVVEEQREEAEPETEEEVILVTPPKQVSADNKVTVPVLPPAKSVDSSVESLELSSKYAVVGGIVIAVLLLCIIVLIVLLIHSRK